MNPTIVTAWYARNADGSSKLRLRPLLEQEHSLTLIHADFWYADVYTVPRGSAIDLEMREGESLTILLYEHGGKLLTAGVYQVCPALLHGFLLLPCCTGQLLLEQEGVPELAAYEPPKEDDSSPVPSHPTSEQEEPTAEHTIATPTLTTDIVLLRPGPAGESQVLLIERGRGPFTGSWALPGGKLHAGESLEECAQRELEEETGIKGVQLTQVAAFSRPGRDPRGHFISVVFYGLMASSTQGRAGDDAAASQWWSLNALPPLAFDHRDIIRAAVQVAQGKAV